jgi:dTDP-4-amino-4,6-dideoxygalactose transaminase
MSNICAGIGRGQMEVLKERIGQRRNNYEYYFNELHSSPGISFQDEPAGFLSNRWLTCLLVDQSLTKNKTSREDIRLALEKENIESRPLWKPMHMQPVFAGAPFYGDGTAERLFDEGLCLPSGSNLNESDLQKVASLIQKML